MSHVGRVLSQEAVSRFASAYARNPQNKLAAAAVVKTKLHDVLTAPDLTARFPHQFNHRIELEGKATSQKSSGRCWLFAGLNLMRLAVMKRYNLDDTFELSQSYLFFYDKLEKSNWFLESMLNNDILDAAIGDRTLDFLLADPVQDGGQWSMFVALVEKYGVVPKSVHGETFQAQNSAQTRWLVTCRLREAAAAFRKMHKAGATLDEIRQHKDERLAEIYRILAIAYGQPPTEPFNWCIRDKAKKFSEFPSLTPQQFYRDHVAIKLDDTISLIHDPRHDYYRLYTVRYLGNVRQDGRGDEQVLYVNVPIDVMMQLSAGRVKKGNPVWFGCEVGKHLSRTVGVMDLYSVDWKLGFGVEFESTKAERLEYGESKMTQYIFDYVYT